MAQSVGKVLKKLLTSSNINHLKSLTLNANRLLYTKSALGLIEYENNRKQNLDSFAKNANSKQNFCNQISSYLENPSMTIFSEELKTLLHLIEKNSEDLELMKRAIKKLYTQKQQFKLAHYSFGPIVMRALHYLNEPDLAFELFKDLELNGMFNKITCSTILLDLLWENGRYADCLEVYEICTKMSQDKFPKSVFTFALASLYKLNTNDGLIKALQILDEIPDSFVIPRRVLFFVAALALKQNEPEIVLKLMAKTHGTQYIIARCIKLEAYAKLKRFEDVYNILKYSMAMENPAGLKQRFFSDTIKNVEEILKKEGIPENSPVVQMTNYVKNAGQVQEMALEEQLIVKMDSNKVKKIGKHDKIHQAKVFRNYN